MKRLLLIICLSVSSCPALAVSVIADVPQGSGTHCRFTPGNIDSQIVVDNTNGLQANGFRICKQDVTALPSGSNSVTFAQVTKDAAGVVWEVGPASVPFVFVKPATGALVAPGGMRLVP